MTDIDSKIFNTQKTDYETPSLFLGQDMGLMDTVNKRYPDIEKLYKKMKSLDWDENEFDFTSCVTDFKTCNKSIYEMMIMTLAWQWEADSVAAKSISSIVAPFVTSTELWSAWQRVADNEVVHALTYSEIVRNSFDNPSDVLQSILAVNESIARLETVASVFSKTFQTSHKLALKMVEKNQDTYDDIFMFTCALYCLERIQFMASFAVTFAIADTGLFVPIGKAVQKICQDEFEVHAELDKAILNHELQTEFGLMAFNRNKDKIKNMIDEIVLCEFAWIDKLFSEGRELLGVTPELLKAWVLYNAGDVYSFFRFEPIQEIPKKIPLGFMTDWMNINAIQAAPQEEKTGAYMLGMVVNDAGSEVIEIDL